VRQMAKVGVGLALAINLATMVAPSGASESRGNRMSNWSKTFLRLNDELIARQTVINDDVAHGEWTGLAAQSVYVHLLSVKIASIADSPSSSVNAIVRDYASVIEDESVEQFNFASDHSGLFINELAATFKQAQNLTKRIFTVSDQFIKSHN
jgi:hypothetical protein